MWGAGGKATCGGGQGVVEGGAESFAEREQASEQRDRPLRTPLDRSCPQCAHASDFMIQLEKARARAAAPGPPAGASGSCSNAFKVALGVSSKSVSSSRFPLRRGRTWIARQSQGGRLHRHRKRCGALVTCAVTIQAGEHWHVTTDQGGGGRVVLPLRAREGEGARSAAPKRRREEPGGGTWGGAGAAARRGARTRSTLTEAPRNLNKMPIKYTKNARNLGKKI
eukprot:981565-Rhodomonas_salina.1